MPLSAWLLAIFAAVGFGLALNMAQRGLQHIEPALGSVISIPTAAAMFWLSAPLTVSFEGWHENAALLFLAIGLFYPAAVTILTFETTRLLGPSMAAALGNLSPLYAVAAGILLLGERLGQTQLSGLVVLLIGVAVLTTNRSLITASGASASWPLWALALPLTGSLLRGIGQPLLKVGLQWWPNARVATLLCYATSALVVITVGFLRTRGTTARFTTRGVQWFMAVGILNGIATWAGIEAVALGPVSLVAPVMATYPLFTLLIGRMIGTQAKLTWQQTAGVAFTVAGIVLLLAG